MNGPQVLIFSKTIWWFYYESSKYEGEKRDKYVHPQVDKLKKIEGYMWGKLLPYNNEVYEVNLTYVMCPWTSSITWWTEPSNVGIFSIHLKSRTLMVHWNFFCFSLLTLRTWNMSPLCKIWWHCLLSKNIQIKFISCKK